MDSLSFLNNILIFVALNCLALLAINIREHGKRLAFGLSLISSILFLGMLFLRDSFSLSDMYFIDGNKVLLLKIAAALNILIILLNGSYSLDKVKSSLLINYAFMGGVFLLGATELITFYVALETIALVGYAIVALSELEHSREAAIKYLIQGSVASVVFLLGAAFYLGATGSLSFSGINVQNQELYAVAVGIFVATAAFKLGAFPFHAWMADVYSNVSLGNLATNFFVSKLIVGFKFIVLIQALMLECEPRFYEILTRIVLIIAVLSAFYGNIIALAQKEYKRIIAYSSLAHTGYLFMSICISPDENIEKQLISFLTLYSLTAVGVVLILNQFAELNKGKDGSGILRGGFYNNKFLSVMLIIFVLSLAGIPLTSGFAMKYMLFTNYFKEGFTLEAVSIFISSIIGLAYYIRFMSELFTEDSTNLPVSIKTRFSESIVHVIILLSIVSVGIVPSLLLELK